MTIVIVGGGTGGTTVASLLSKNLSDKERNIIVVEPSDKHYYQPLWTLIGGGMFPKEKSVRDQASVIPQGTKWVRDSVAEFLPQSNNVRTKNGEIIKYDYLVVSTGVSLFWERIKGLKESIGKNGVCTNYSYDYVDKTWQFLNEFKGGVALFTFPNTPVKCGGGPQKIMWLAEDLFRNIKNIRDQSKIIYATAGAAMFPVKHYSDILAKMAGERDVDVRYASNLVEVRGEAKEAIFQTPNGNVTVKYDFLHVVPPMGPPLEVRISQLADGAGFVDVDKHSLQHKKFPNVFALGDCTNLPTSKTAAAITQQAPVLVHNLVAHSRGKPLEAKYNGYTACPIVTGFNRLILAEFLYDNVVKETFPMNQGVERRSSFYLKKFFFPAVYWNGLLKGRWFGPSTIFNPWPIKKD